MPLGKVYLVGGGPGDPGLLTLKGAEALRAADVVIYDRLIDPRLLRHTRANCEHIYVGKQANRHTLRQDEINALLVERGRAGQTVVRLKGGDPFVFGRGGEEADELQAAGIPFEVVPGITSPIAAAAYAGIPVTHRGIASSFAIVTGHEDPTKEESSLHLDELARGADTLILMMGVERLDGLTRELISAGRTPETPVALVRWGTWSRQEVLTGTLGTIVQQVAERAFAPPAIILVGEVVRLRERLRWFDNRPLSGKRILITRSRDQAGRLGQLLADQGAEAVEAPSIAIAPPDDYRELDTAISNLADYQWLVFTSVNGVAGFFARLRALGSDARALNAVNVCAIGPATADACIAWGIYPDLVPASFLTDAVAKALSERGIVGARILLPRTDIQGEDLPGLLVQAGATVDQVTAYRTVTAAAIDPDIRQMLADGAIDFVTFASSSTVRNLVSLLGGDVSLLQRARIASIGPVTTRAAEELGLTVAIHAREHTVPGLVAAILEDQQHD